MITIINYGLGNVSAFENIYRSINIRTKIACRPDDLNDATHILLPGVGSFDKAISNINNVIGLKEALNVKALNDKIPILGICLGMQLFTRKSEEGILNGFNWIPGQVKKFKSTKDFKVPHMGWNEVKTNNKKLKILENIDKGSRFYFVHSYYVEVDNKKHSLFKTTFNISFDSGIYKDNLYGVQFHPEKSHKFGMNILKNFSELRC